VNPRAAEAAKELPMTTPSASLSRILSALTLSAALAGCGGGGSGSGVTVSARLAGASGQGLAAAAGAITVGGGRVQVDEVWMVIRDVKLGVPGVEGEINAGGGPFLLHVTGADAAITEEFTIEAPAGSYDELRFVVHKLEDFQRIGVPELDGPRASIALALTVDGTDQVLFTSDLNDTQRIARRFTVEDGVAPDNITISIDPSGWFGGTGGFLDPRDASDRQAIEENIRNSIDAFDDDDRDGVSDDGPNHT
jgi:hypothetical protein